MEIITRTRTFEKYLPEELSKELVSRATFIVFDESEYETPEMVWLERGKIRISDHHQGLANWDSKKRQYVRHYYMSERPIGQLQYILIEQLPENAQ